LLVLPAPMTVNGGKLCFESQACEGLELWSRHFESLTVCSPCVPEALAAQRAYITWRPVESLGLSDRVRFVPLPWAYRVREFCRHYRATCNLLRDLIAQSQYLQFAIGGAVGDWPSVAAEQALRMRRGYAIHVDSVATELAWSAVTTLRQRVKAALHVPMIRAWERRLMRRAALVLCNGAATFEAYQGLNRNCEVIHNATIHASDAATPAQVAGKKRRTLNAPELRVVYAGRVAAEKAPLQWVRAIAWAVQNGAEIEAVWLGDGEMMQEMRREIDRLSMASVIRLAGFVADRNAVLDELKQADLLLFTHLIRESPRILVESLLCGTPIVGYDSAYARGQIRDHGGGAFVPVGEWEMLGRKVLELHRDRAGMTQLIDAAYLDGMDVTAERMFAERSQVIKSYLAR